MKLTKRTQFRFPVELMDCDDLVKLRVRQVNEGSRTSLDDPERTSSTPVSSLSPQDHTKRISSGAFACVQVLTADIVLIVG